MHSPFVRLKRYAPGLRQAAHAHDAPHLSLVLAGGFEERGGLSQTLIQAFFETAQNTGFAVPAPEAFGARYATRLAAFAQRRMAQVDQRRAEAQWGGWTWRPTAADRAAYAGRYRHPTLGDYVITAQGETVHARLGVVDRVLEPAAPDLFALTDGLADPPTPFRFDRTDGRVTALVWDEDRFERLD